MNVGSVFWNSLTVLSKCGLNCTDFQKIDLLGHYAKVVDHLAIRNVAQGAPLGGGYSTFIGRIGQW